MLSQFEYKKAAEAARGTDLELYNKKLEWLRDKWSKKRDGTVKRLMDNFLLKEISPLNISIISDNLSYFHAHYRGSSLDMLTALDKACLCGSQQVGEFIMKELKLDYLSEDNEHILSYIAASQNTHWMQDVAEKMARAHKPMPNSLRRLGDNYKVIQMIVKIFNEHEINDKSNSSQNYFT